MYIRGRGWKMIGKSGLWGAATASGGAVACGMALAGWWFAQALRPGPPEIPRALASMAVPSNPRPGAGAVAPAGPRVDIARATPKGDVVIAGRAEPGARVALLDNGQILLEARADPATGEFVLLPPRLAAGAHQLSLRSLTSPNGVQMKEADVMALSVTPAPSAPAQPGAPGPAAPGQVASASGGTATIARGDTLWRISRLRLGRGSLYPTIFLANSTKIRDPNLIYPEQTLTIP